MKSNREFTTWINPAKQSKNDGKIPFLTQVPALHHCGYGNNQFTNAKRNSAVINLFTLPPEKDVF